MIFEFWINEYNKFCEGFQAIVTITAKTAKIGPRSSKPDLLSKPDEALKACLGPLPLIRPLRGPSPVKYIIMGSYFNVKSMIFNEN